MCDTDGRALEVQLETDDTQDRDGRCQSSRRRVRATRKTRAVHWYPEPHASFSDALASVRRAADVAAFCDVSA